MHAVAIVLRPDTNVSGEGDPCLKDDVDNTMIILMLAERMARNIFASMNFPTF